ncbi:MAG: inorganic diphosphatase [Rickettsiaceae bacterium]|nr:inorganic diphosphatase [Rickettsiaceae bacterium]
MDINKIKALGEKSGECNVIIEISANSSAVKYEFEKDSGAIFVDRFIQVAMSYPCNYGFIPHTLSGDGDPADVLVVTTYPIITGAVINCRPVGVLLMKDESGDDEKIIAVPTEKIDPSMADIQSLDDLNPMLLSRISHFFERYKDLEKGKMTEVKGFGDAKKAKELILEAIERYKHNSK